MRVFLATERFHERPQSTPSIWGRVARARSRPGCPRSCAWYENSNLAPDAVFLAAERRAKRERKSRSQLYADALTEYLNPHAPDEVTDAMNQVVDQHPPQPDPFALAAAHATLERVDW